VANGKFLQLHGPAGGAKLDLYGRAATVQPPSQSTPAVSRAASRAASFSAARSASRTGRIR
jgi:hypothetical protein